jgi:deoxyribodipyrimidine photo-lyase
MTCQIVWFKRDLRVFDHQPLIQASKIGPVLPIYIVEPKLWQQPDLSMRHYHFLTECIDELNIALKGLGQKLMIYVGDATSTFQSLVKQYEVKAIWSHQETWNGWTYERDQQVAKWAKQQSITWHQLRQNGVIRGLKDRDGWSARWRADMSLPLSPTPDQLPTITNQATPWPKPDSLGLQDDGCTMRQRGGRTLGLSCLDSFLNIRGEHYTKAMSSPVTAFDSCSRISVHLAFGTLSMREVFQATNQRSEALKAMPRGTKGKWPSAIRSFAGRLRWHCHFIQKLEDQPQIEFQPLHSAYHGLRESSFNQTYFDAWKVGKTGYPMVDACMRALIATGWINFRMRAMLMSFASYHLWLHWRQTSIYLANLFTDYEPGIHYSQTQMQAGTTGINSVRIYNPIKQSMDHDPDGQFIKQWIPELRQIPTAMIHQPWQLLDQLNGYPLPIVEESIARKQAAAQIYKLRKSSDHRDESSKIVKKHGSRKKTTRRSSTLTANKLKKQNELPL